MKKIITLSVLAILLFAGWSIKDAKTKNLSYYSGDSVLYRNQLIVASTNSGRLELFKASGSKVERLLTHGLAVNPSKTELFNDVKLEVQGDKLVAYTVAGYTLYQYDVSDLKTAQLNKKVRNTYWEWYHRVDRLGVNLATISDRGVRIWNSNLDVINGYDYTSDAPHSLRSGGDSRFLVSINEGHLGIYDREDRKEIQSIPLNYRDHSSNARKAHYNRYDSTIYVTDDYYVKKFDLNGKLLASFRHYDSTSFDTESSFGSTHVYVSNGSKIYKLNKSDLKLIREYQAFGATPQGWAMGIKLVNTNSGERLVVFNDSGIAVLNEDLQLVSSSGQISVDDGKQYPFENLHISLNFYSVKPGAIITISGGGYLANEDLVVSLKNEKKLLKADKFGRYSTDMTIPESKTGRYDVKAEGKDSGMTYSTALEIVL